MKDGAQRAVSGYWFLGLTLAWTWLWWWLAVVIGKSATEFPTPVLFAVGGAGPMVIALAMVWRRFNRTERRDFFVRIVDPRLIGGWWWPVILLLPALVAFGGFGLYWAVSGQPPTLSKPGELLADPAALLGLALFLFVFGPLPEEIGWRGFAQDRLGTRHGVLAVSLMIGVVWWAWHLPLFWIEGSYHAGFGPARAAAFLPAILAHAVIHTWLFYKTNRSTLGAILYHYAVNFTGEFLGGPPEAKPYGVLILVLIAAVIVLRWMRKPLH